MQARGAWLTAVSPAPGARAEIASGTPDRLQESGRKQPRHHSTQRWSCAKTLRKSGSPLSPAPAARATAACPEQDLGRCPAPARALGGRPSCVLDLTLGGVSVPWPPSGTRATCGQHASQLLEGCGVSSTSEIQDAVRPGFAGSACPSRSRSPPTAARGYRRPLLSRLDAARSRAARIALRRLVGLAIAGQIRSLELNSLAPSTACHVVPAAGMQRFPGPGRHVPPRVDHATWRTSLFESVPALVQVCLALRPLLIIWRPRGP